MARVLRRLWLQLTADRKRFGALVALLVLGLLLWARIIVISDVPRTAIAGPGAPGGATRPPTPRPSDIHAQAPRRVALDRIPTRDPFAINAEVFPKPTPVVAIDPEGGKSQAQAAEDAEQAEARRTAELRALVDRFTLDAVMRDPPLAVISGKTYQRGDSVSRIDNEEIRFKLVAVMQRSVILECESRRFELHMASPRGPRH